MKLNLGCGLNKQPGFVNVDLHGEPDLVWDLEVFPWPWPDDAAAEIWLIHVLEHLGRDVAVFIRIMQELYRVAAPGAAIRIVVPHPRHDDFINDPTHVRMITADTMTLFSKKYNRRWQALGAANSPLALYHNVDFDIVAVNSELDEPYASAFKNGTMTEDRLKNSIRTYNNVIRATTIDLVAVKERPAG
jgi:hypothetical protein